MGPRGRKFLSLIAVSLFEDVSFFCVTGAYAAEATRLVHKNLDCSVCHTTAGKTFETPESKTCIGCHGGMDAISSSPTPSRRMHIIRRTMRICWNTRSVMQNTSPLRACVRIAM